jgi:anti-sigma B factor antagonist
MPLTSFASFDIDKKRRGEGMDFKTREINGIVIYDIEWEFKLAQETSPTLHRHVKTQLEKGKRHFLFNLKDVTYLESLGLGELVANLISISKLEGKLKLINLAPKLRLLFEVTGLIDIFDIEQDEEVALKSFS